MHSASRTGACPAPPSLIRGRSPLAERRYTAIPQLPPQYRCVHPGGLPRVAVNPPDPVPAARKQLVFPVPVLDHVPELRIPGSRAARGKGRRGRDSAPRLVRRGVGRQCPGADGYLELAELEEARGREADDSAADNRRIPFGVIRCEMRREMSGARDGNIPPPPCPWFWMTVFSSKRSAFRTNPDGR